MKFSDDSDRASYLEELERQYQLNQVRIMAGQRLAVTGTCHYCDQTVGGDLRFCDDDCRDDRQRLKDAERRNGRFP